MADYLPCGTDQWRADTAAVRRAVCVGWRGMGARLRGPCFFETSPGPFFGFAVAARGPCFAAVFDDKQRDDCQHDARSQYPMIDQVHRRRALGAQDCSRFQRTFLPVKKS